MIVNVMDLRERPYRWASILAVVQDAAKDNIAEDADRAPEGLGISVDYAEKPGVSLRDAVLWADRLDGLVTLYLYDMEDEA